MKKKLLFLAMLFSSLCSFAIDSVTFSETTIMPGATGEVEVSYTCSDQANIYSAFQIEIKLPDGLNVVKARLSEEVEEECPSLNIAFNNVVTNGERICTLLGFSPTTLSEGLPLGTHKLFSFTLAADDGMPLGDYQIDVPNVEFTKVPMGATGTGNVTALFLPSTSFNVEVGFVVKNEEDLHHYLDWLDMQVGANLHQQLNLHGVDISLTHLVEMPAEADLTITNGSFSAGKGWTGATVFSVPSTSSFSLNDVTLDFSAKNLPASLCLIDVAGTLFLGNGTVVKGGGAMTISSSSGTVTLDGAQLNDVELVTGKEVCLFSAAPLEGNIKVRVPEDGLHEGFRIIGPVEGYQFTPTDAFSVVVANNPKEWCVEVDSEGYLSLFPAFLLGDVNVDGEVNITDIVLVVGHVLGDDVKMRIAAANVVRDKIISISDIVAIVAIVLE